MKLVENAGRWYRMASVQVAAAWGAYSLMPAEMQQQLLTFLHVPADKVPGIMAVTFIVARLVSQKVVTPP